MPSFLNVIVEFLGFPCGHQHCRTANFGQTLVCPVRLYEDLLILILSWIH